MTLPKSLGLVLQMHLANIACVGPYEMLFYRKQMYFKNDQTNGINSVKYQWKDMRCYTEEGTA